MVVASIAPAVHLMGPPSIPMAPARRVTISLSTSTSISRALSAVRITVLAMMLVTSEPSRMTPDVLVIATSFPAVAVPRRMSPSAVTSTSWEPVVPEESITTLPSPLTNGILLPSIEVTELMMILSASAINTPPSSAVAVSTSTSVSMGVPDVPMAPP